jgi:hypothetical protein
MRLFQTTTVILLGLVLPQVTQAEGALAKGTVVRVQRSDGWQLWGPLATETSSAIVLDPWDGCAWQPLHMSRGEVAAITPIRGGPRLHRGALVRVTLNDGHRLYGSFQPISYAHFILGGTSIISTRESERMAFADVSKFQRMGVTNALRKALDTAIFVAITPLLIFSGVP